MGAHILIVEDSPLVTDAFRILLEASGFDVEVAGSVAEAVERGTAHEVDVMLLDLTLPDGDGLDVLDALHDRGHAPKATLAMTGHNDPQRRQRCLEAGCSDVLLKPLPIGEIVRHIERLLA